jgi:hypothetical protein
MITRAHRTILQGRTATYSDCERYRYTLLIVWNQTLPVMGLIGLNPSTATEKDDDPTIRRGIGFAKRERCGGLMMLNLFAFRTTDPKVMKLEDDPVGPDNALGVLTGMCDGPIVACWGTHGVHMKRGEYIRKCLPELLCFGLNKDGTPKHPLYLKGTTRLEPFGKGSRA